MKNAVFATKGSMTQAWTTNGKRLPITKVTVEPNLVIGVHEAQVSVEGRVHDRKAQTVLEVGYGKKKLQSMKKPLRDRLTRNGFDTGVKQIQGIRVANTDDSLKAGSTITATDVLAVGDVVKVQGTTKGRGFAGGMKRHGFSGGPKTHGQSDNERAIGSVGAGTDPGKVWKGKKMPGHYGVDKQTVKNLTVVHIDEDTGEVWLSGPVPGHKSAILRITKTDEESQIELDMEASGVIKSEPKVEESKETETAPKDEKEETVDNENEAKADSKKTKKENDKEVKEDTKKE